MKKLRIAVLLVTVISLTGLFLACPSDGGGSSGSVTPPPAKGTPIKEHFTVIGNGTFSANAAAGSPQRFTGVTVTAKTGFSQGKITVKYNDSETVPSATAAGTYEVTFDVGEDTSSSPGWSAVSGFSAGFVNINDSRKVVLFNYFDTTAFPVSWKQGETPSPYPAVKVKTEYANLGLGAITTSYKNTSVNPPTTSTTPPTGAGTYEVSFIVAGNDIWNEAGFIAGTIYIRSADEEIQVSDIGFTDFVVKVGNVAFDQDRNTVPKETTFNGYSQMVTVVPDPNKKAKNYPITNAGMLALSYFNATTNAPIAIAPTNVGKYKVTIQLRGTVTQSEAWSATNFELLYDITKKTPDKDDYVITNLNQSEYGKLLQITYDVKHVQFERKPTVEKDVFGTNILDDEGNTIPVPGTSPTTGTIKVFYKYIAGTAADTTAETALINEWDGQTPIDPTLIVGAGGYKAPPQKAGSYEVTFTVSLAATSADRDNWNELATPGPAGTLILAPLAPVTTTFTRVWAVQDTDVVQLQTPSDIVAIVPNGELVFTNVATAGTVKEWRVDGNLAQTGGATYRFTSNALGWHNVSLIVTYDGKVYNQNLPVRVQYPRSN